MRMYRINDSVLIARQRTRAGRVGCNQLVRFVETAANEDLLSVSVSMAAGLLKALMMTVHTAQHAVHIERRTLYLMGTSTSNYIYILYHPDMSFLFVYVHKYNHQIYYQATW